jgi:hypothetical protein
MFQTFSQYDAGAHRDGAALPKSVQTFQELVLELPDEAYVQCQKRMSARQRGGSGLIRLVTAQYLPISFY